jgi:tetratricopeptide (TPR) repeat protein
MENQSLTLRRAAAAVAILSIVPFLSALGNDFITWDDDIIILGQPFLREATLSNLARIVSPFPAREEWLPLRDLTLLANFTLFGSAPWSFIAGNIALHALAAILVLVLCERLGLSRIEALVGASLFACHAVHVESVTWLSARKDPLSAIFLLLALLAHIRWRDGKGGYGPGILFLGLALVSKASSFIFPVWAAVYDLAFRRELRLRERVVPLLPHVLLAAGHAILYTRLVSLDGVIEAYPPGGIATVLLTDIVLLRDYTAAAILPLRHQAIYSVEFVTTPWNAGFWASIAILGAVGAAAWKLRERPWVPFAAALFYASFLPYLNLVPHGIYYAERYLYLPTIFLSLAAGKLAVAGIEAARSRSRIAGSAACAVLSIALVLHGAAGSRRNLAWADSETFWRYQAAEEPKNPAPLMNLAATHELFGNDIAATRVYEDVLARFGDVPEAYHRLGRVARRSGDLARALVLYEKCAVLEAGDPRTLNNLGEVYLALGRRADAISLYEKIVSAHPRYLLARANLARTLDAEGRRAEARRHWEKVAEGWELLPQEPLILEARSRLATP